MLLTCPECSHNVSDKAHSCPGCGFPVKLIISPYKAKTSLYKPLTKPKRSRKKHRKLPNGFGSIQKLSGNRSRPYAAYPPTTEFNLNGSPKRNITLGYFSTWYEAYDSLSEYNRLSAQEKKALTSRTHTFSEIYEMYYKDKFKKELSAGSKKTSMMNSISAAYKNSSALHDCVFTDLKKNEFQKVIDECPLKHSSKELIVLLFNQMSNFALQNDMIEKNYAQFVKITTEDDDESGVPFSQEELDKLWNDSDNEVTQMILIMILSGFRIKAFETMNIDLDKGCFVGGVKTKAGKNRMVPIHSLVMKFVKTNTIIRSFKVQPFRYMFYEKLAILGISSSNQNTKHTPHDCRHTFSWLCDKYDVDETSKHILMGHTLKGDVEQKKYSHRTYEDLKEAIEKICR